MVSIVMYAMKGLQHVDRFKGLRAIVKKENSVNTQTRINTLIAAARQARALARRFEIKGETFNANQARVISLRALQNARGIKSGLI